MSIKTDPKFRRAFERGVLRSAFKSLFWAIIVERKKRPEGFTLTGLAKAISTSKHEVSRWFNGDPNWEINTIANIADALDVEIEIQAKDRKSGAIYTPAGLQTPAVRRQTVTWEPSQGSPVPTTSVTVGGAFPRTSSAETPRAA